MTTESVRNKILNGTLRRSECDTDELHAFLKLLKQPKDRRNANVVEVNEDVLVRVVKCSKKNSTSSVFSDRTHDVYECSF